MFEVGLYWREGTIKQLYAKQLYKQNFHEKSPAFHTIQ